MPITPNRFSLQELPTPRFGREPGPREVVHSPNRQRWPFPVASGYCALQPASVQASRYESHTSRASSFVT